MTPSSPLTPLNSRFFDRPIAHRGLHDHQSAENSLASFSAAVQMRFPIELDIQFSQDDEPIVFHDAELSRMTGVDGVLENFSASQLQEFALKSGGNIPHLQEVLAFVAGNVPLVIEIKHGSEIFSNHSQARWKNLQNILANYTGDYVLMSFNHNAIALMKTHFPQIPIGLVRANFEEKHFPNLTKNDLQFHENAQHSMKPIWDFESWHWRDMTENPSTMPRFSWTIRSDAEAKPALRFSDNITFEGYLPL